MIDLNRFAAELKPVQIETIRALLAERTIQKAACKVGICRQTVWRWMKHEQAFRDAVVAGRKAQIEAVWREIDAKLN